MSSSQAKPLNAFTVDVEDYFQVSAFEGQVNYDRWDDYELRVVENTHRILDLLAQHDVHATFFVLGWIASRCPQLVRDIHAAGHEIGSHSFRHQLIYRQTPDQFREDLRASREVLEDLVGEPVVTYRAPSFSITNRSRWAIDILAEEGFRIDSSIFPIHHDRYGIPGAERGIHRIETTAGSLWEFPPTVARLAGVNMPVGGGGYFRLYPYRWTRYCLARNNRQTDQPFMFYIHPWEVDPEQPRIRIRSRLSRIRHYLNLSSTLGKLERLLQDFRFSTVSEVLRQGEQVADRRAAADTSCGTMSD